MPGIYMGASVTIVASRASSAREGFLQERNPEDKYKVGFELPFRDKKGIFGTTVLHKPIYDSIEPLQKRAWALQEEWLSPKSIRFGTNTTFWKCKEAVMDDRPVQERDWRKREYQKQHGKSLQIPETLDAHERLRLASEDWKRIVERYTDRNLTLSTDRLPAISGIAEQFSHRMGDNAKYAAGLWSSTMLQHLLWRVYYSSLLHRPTEYQGPSWSWASVNSCVEFPYKFADMSATIISCTVELANKGAQGIDTRFGAVKSGRLEIRGVLRRAEVLRSPPDVWWGRYQLDFLDVADRRALVDWYPDTVNDAGPEENESTVREVVVFYTLLIASGEFIQCLVLRKDDATGHFTRCGLIQKRIFYLTPEQLSWLECGEVQTIVII